MLWEVEELSNISEVQPKIVENALKSLWGNNPELYKMIVINAYIDGKINLGKAAEFLRISRLELEKELRVKGVPIRQLSREDISAEVEAIKEWQK
ncbi:MAG: UPF0175 family protein [Candidatus Omnitrophota bacterium]